MMSRGAVSELRLRETRSPEINSRQKLCDADFGIRCVWRHSAAASISLFINCIHDGASV